MEFFIIVLIVYLMYAGDIVKLGTNRYFDMEILDVAVTYYHKQQKQVFILGKFFLSATLDGDARQNTIEDIRLVHTKIFPSDAELWNGLVKIDHRTIDDILDFNIRAGEFNVNIKYKGTNYVDVSSIELLTAINAVYTYAIEEVFKVSIYIEQIKSGRDINLSTFYSHVKKLNNQLVNGPKGDYGTPTLFFEKIDAETIYDEIVIIDVYINGVNFRNVSDIVNTKFFIDEIPVSQRRYAKLLTKEAKKWATILKSKYSNTQ